MLGNKQPHNSLIYILPVHYDESNSDRIRMPRPMRSARVSRSGCGKGGAILRPVSGQPPIDSPPLGTAGRRRFNSRTKKASGGWHRPYNSRARIGPTFRITHELAVGSANCALLGGSWNQFQFRGQRGVVDSSLEADSIVPLAHAAVVLTSRSLLSRKSRRPACHAHVFGNCEDPEVHPVTCRGQKSVANVRN